VRGLVRRWLDRRREEINGDGQCETYLYRWTLLRTRWGKLYLHHFVGSDWARDPHDHPKAFVSIGLRGSYTEHQYTPGVTAVRRSVVWRAPWIRRFPARHVHRIDATECWTLVWVGREQRPWGFWLPEGRGRSQWMLWSDYVHGQGLARRRGDC
jgi:hypothetical protein